MNTYESTTELYDEPASSVWRDIAELAGEAALIDRAKAYLVKQQPLKALHLTDIMLAESRACASARQTRIDALTMLLENEGRANFSEQQWLLSEIDATKAESAQVMDR